MLKIEKLEKNDESLQSSLEHQKRLLVALAPDPAEWEHDGEVGDAGPLSQERCACGHPIRYLFGLVRPRDGKTAQVGSTCIEHFAYINETTFKRLCATQERLSAEIAATEENIRRATNEVKVLKVKTAFEIAYAAAHEKYRAYAHAPRLLWMAVASNKFYVPKHAPEYSRPCDLIKWYKKQTEIINQAMAA